MSRKHVREILGIQVLWEHNVKFTKAYWTFVLDKGNNENVRIFFVYSHINFMLLVVVLVSYLPFSMFMVIRKLKRDLEH